MRSSPDITCACRMPEWLPDDMRHYLAHTEEGRSIRSIARQAGCHASTVLRQVRKCETRRDDLLIDMALERLSRAAPGNEQQKGIGPMTTATALSADLPDDSQLDVEAPRVLRRLNEPGACLAIARDMDRAVVVRESDGGETLRTAVVERALAEALALRDWISVANEGRITRYRINANGRSALKRLMALEEARRAGLSETAEFGDQHREMEERTETGATPARKKRVRYNAAESPLLMLARRKDKEGRPFLTSELIAAGERLREDFELAQMGPRVAQNWERFLTGGGRGAFDPGSERSGGGSDSARVRVTAALADLGPGLGDIALRCCCFLEGLEAVERRLGWSARSGKIVLRIALTRLRQHYEGLSRGASLIG
ncbi:MAG: DUF6456 domain-containing protein [Paracoccaceae bacterium]|nr:DUF6456 domain-containing protein [Paracoccaceae bacterium]